MNNRQIDALMHTAQKAFIEDLVNKIDEIDKLLISCEDKCSEHDSQSILRFFHSLNGTAATLGLNHLASIGKGWEIKIKKLIEQGSGLYADIIKDHYCYVK